MSIKILIADDHEIVRMGLRNLIKGNKSFKIVVETEDGQQALNKIKKLYYKAQRLTQGFSTQGGSPL